VSVPEVILEGTRMGLLGTSDRNCRLVTWTDFRARLRFGYAELWVACASLILNQDGFGPDGDFSARNCVFLTVQRKVVHILRSD
jgi:hypothetical protein